MADLAAQLRALADRVAALAPGGRPRGQGGSWAVITLDALLAEPTASRRSRSTACPGCWSRRR
jgi:hypothetical protein